jgi:polyribonucleotide nucleotidyltransferase
MAEAKEQLEKTREQVNDAAEQLKEEKLTDAANSATRAQRELEQMQEDFRQKTSKKFAEEMKQLRQQAREPPKRRRRSARPSKIRSPPKATSRRAFKTRRRPVR